MTRMLGDYPELRAITRERRPHVALVLGSGLGDLACVLRDVVELPFGRVPGLDATTVAGHRGSLLLGTWGGAEVLVFAGRLHFYEGHAWRRVVQPIHLARELGATILVATNAAGGIRENLNPGDLMAIQGHLNWTGAQNPLERQTPDARCYSQRLLHLLNKSAVEKGFPLPSGVYAQVTGPCYETPAEIRALRSCGADAVGMSTGREVQTAYELEMECAALSCITNKAAGLSDSRLDHAEVLARARGAKERLHGLLETFLKRI